MGRLRIKIRSTQYFTEIKLGKIADVSEYIEARACVTRALNDELRKGLKRLEKNHERGNERRNGRNIERRDATNIERRIKAREE